MPFLGFAATVQKKREYVCTDLKKIKLLTPDSSRAHAYRCMCATNVWLLSSGGWAAARAPAALGERGECCPGQPCVPLAPLQSQGAAATGWPFCPGQAFAFLGLLRKAFQNLEWLRQRLVLGSGVQGELHPRTELTCREQ